MNYNFNKKGNIVPDVVLWIFATFFYFLIGLPLINNIVDSLISDGIITDPIYILSANIAPVIPMVALLYMAWKSTTDEETGGVGLFGGNEE